MRTFSPASAFLLSLTALIVTACGPILDLSGGGEPANLYTLSSVQNMTAAASPTTLMVEDPETSAAFDGKGIALMPQDRELRYYAGAQWVDRVPRMVQALLVTSFEESGAFRDVGTPSMTLAADYRLHTNLRAFNTDYRGGGAPVVRVAIAAKLFNARPLGLAGAKLFDVEEPSRSDRMEDIVAAFDRANQQAMTELVEWAASTVATAAEPQTTAP